MEVCARLDYLDPSLIATLKQRQIAAKVVRNGMLVILPQATHGSRQGLSFTIPQEVKDAKLLLSLREFQHVHREKRCATVVCGVSGRPLKPAMRSNSHKHEWTALFSAPEMLTTAIAREDGHLWILKHELVVCEATVFVNPTEVWAGRIETLRQSPTRFLPAAEAAIAKVKCEGCRCVHYERKD